MPTVAQARTRTLTAALLLLAMLAYAVMLTNGHLVRGPSALIARSAPGLDLTFNSMARQLLLGRFDVDPEVVAYEGFSVHGSIVAYWGIALALLRLPLALIPGGLDLDVTAASMWLAVSIAAAINLKTLRLIYRRTTGAATGGLRYWALVLTMLFSGPQIEFLSRSIYQEVCLWALALGAVFVYLAASGLVRGVFSRRELLLMAFMAGLALLVRVSTGIGLYASVGALLFVLVFQRARPTTPGGWASRLGSLPLFAPLSILLAFAGATALVNYERWGDPLVFANYHAYLLNIQYPQRMAPLDRYGLFTVARLPWSLAYYLFPVWVLRDAEGSFLLSGPMGRLFDFAELPPSSLLMTDALLVGLAGYWFCANPGHRTGVRTVGTSGASQPQAIAIVTGLAFPCALMLCAISLSHRYRADFYPLVEFCAFMGLARWLQHSKLPQSRVSTLFVALAAATSIATSNVVLLLYKLSGFGSGIALPPSGVWLYYSQQLQSHLFKLMHPLR